MKEGIYLVDPIPLEDSAQPRIDEVEKYISEENYLGEGAKNSKICTRQGSWNFFGGGRVILPFPPQYDDVTLSFHRDTEYPATLKDRIGTSIHCLIVTGRKISEDLDEITWFSGFVDEEQISPATLHIKLNGATWVREEKESVKTKKDGGLKIDFNTVDLTWDAVPGAGGYLLEWRPEGSNENYLQAELASDATSYPLKLLKMLTVKDDGGREIVLVRVDAYETLLTALPPPDSNMEKSEPAKQTISMKEEPSVPRKFSGGGNKG